MPSLKSHAFVMLLRLIRRNRIYASAQALHQGIAQVRRAGPALPHVGMRRTLDVQTQVFAGHAVYTVRPRAGGHDHAPVLYLHGGAYVRPITRFHWSFIEDLVRQTGCPVTVPLYPLAPESTCLQTLDFVLRLYEHWAQNRPVTLMGDSAGGGLALATALALRDQDRPAPARLVLITPWVDVDSQHPHLAHLARRDPMLAIDGAREAGRLYAGALPTDHPWVSPLHADLRDLPPITLLAGTRDLAHLDALELVHRAREQGNQIDLRMGHDMLHVWPLLPIPEGRQARAEIAELIRRPLRDQS